MLQSEDGQNFVLPLETEPEWFMPTQASSAGDSQGHAPGRVRLGPVSGTLPGNWIASPDQIGPYRQGAKQGLVTMAMTVTAKPFDPAVTTDVGDLWIASINIDAPFSGMTIDPGRSGVIDVVIKPSGKPGTVVRGFLYVDDAVLTVPPYGQTTGDEDGTGKYAQVSGSGRFITIGHAVYPRKANGTCASSHPLALQAITTLTGTVTEG